MAKQLEQIRIGIWGTLYFVQWAYLGLGLSPARPDPKFNKKNLRQVALGIAQVRPTIIEQMKIFKDKNIKDKLNVSDCTSVCIKNGTYD